MSRGRELPGGATATSVDEAVDKFGALAQIGTDEVILSLPDNGDSDVYPLLAEILR